MLSSSSWRKRECADEIEKIVQTESVQLETINGGLLQTEDEENLFVGLPYVGAAESIKRLLSVIIGRHEQLIESRTPRKGTNEICLPYNWHDDKQLQ